MGWISYAISPLMLEFCIQDFRQPQKELCFQIINMQLFSIFFLKSTMNNNYLQCIYTTILKNYLEMIYSKLKDLHMLSVCIMHVRGEEVRFWNWNGFLKTIIHRQRTSLQVNMPEKWWESSWVERIRTARVSTTLLKKCTILKLWIIYFWNFPLHIFLNLPLHIGWLWATQTVKNEITEWPFIFMWNSTQRL